MSFEFGQFDYFSDPVTSSNPVIMAVAKSLKTGPYLGTFYQAMSAPDVKLDSKEYKVYTRTDYLRDGVIGGNWDSSSVTGLSVSAEAAKCLTVGHVLKIGDEYVIVKEVNRANNTIAVRGRGAASTTAAAHAKGAAFTVVSFAGDDVDLKQMTGVYNITNVYENYVHTVFEVMDWTKHGTLVRQGMTPETATAVLYTDAMKNVSRLLARSCIHGRKHKAVTRDDRYMSAGLIQQLADTENGKRTVLKYDAAGPLTDEKLKAALKEHFDRGGNGDTILCSSTNKAYLNNLLGACNVHEELISDRDEHTAGGIYCNAYDYEGHKLKIVVDQDIPDDMIPIVTLASCKKQWLNGDGLQVKDEPSASSREFRKSIQGSLGYHIEGVGQDHTLLFNVNGGPTEKVKKVVIQGVNTSVALPTYQQITVHSDADVPAASAANLGLRVLVGTAWSSGTTIATAAAGEVYASNGTGWVKQ